MKRDRRHDDGELARLLRRGDPAGDGSDPGREEVAAMRRSILAVVSVSHRGGRLTIVARTAAAAAVLLLAAALAFWWPTPERSGSGVRVQSTHPVETNTARGNVTGQDSESVVVDSTRAPLEPDVRRGPSTRQIQFVTPGGTRVVWILNADFDA